MSYVPADKENESRTAGYFPECSTPASFARVGLMVKYIKRNLEKLFPLFLRASDRIYISDKYVFVYLSLNMISTLRDKCG